MLPIVSRIWPNETVVCLGCGPSLTQSDVDLCKGQRVIAINDAYLLAPWANVLYAGDLKWWEKHPDAQAFPGLKYTVHPGVPRKFHSVTLLQITGQNGVEVFAGGLRTGGNSGHAAINLAVHLGAYRIVLLGYDMQPDSDGSQHFYIDPEERPCNFKFWRECAETLVQPLANLGIEIVNASRETALTCFPRMELRDVLGKKVA